jgi:4-amino-4-deoxy-L-arabinose transferase-like glycosyltransferase
MAGPLNLAHRTNAWFAGALTVAASVRLYLLWQYYCISSDGVVYIRAAQDFHAGNFLAGLGSVYPPGYPMLIAGIYPWVGDWERSGQLLSLFFGVLLLFPLYRIFAETFNPITALVACFLAAISPYLALYSVHVRSESTYIFFSICALYLFLTAIEKRHKGRFLLGGVSAGWAYLIRPEGIGFLIIVPAIAIMLCHTLRTKITSELIPSVGLVICGFLLCALPYIVYLSIDTGQFGAISRKAGVTLGINLGEWGLLENEVSQVNDPADAISFTGYILHQPILYSRKVVSDLIPALGAFLEALHYSYVPFLAFGVYLALRDRFWVKPEALLVAFVVLYVWGFALIYVKRRYSLQAVPVALGWVALGIVYAWKELRATLAQQKAALVGFTVALVFLGATLPKTLKAVSREKSYVRESGRYLKAHNPTGALTVAVFDDRITFYAGARTLLLKGITESELAGKLREQKAEYFAAESKMLQRIYPEVAQRPERYGLVLEKVFIGARKDQLMLFKSG